MTRKPDLSAFYGLDPLAMLPSELDILREHFAFTIAQFAAECETNREFLDGLFAALDPAKGLPPSKLLGVGSTRRTYALPFGLALKMRRHDALPPEELAERGGKAYKPHLEFRRVTSNFRELGVAIAFPNLVPRIYGAMVECYVRNTTRPNILVAEQAKYALNSICPDDQEDINLSNLFISPRTGELLITDTRFRTDRDSPELCTPENLLGRHLPSAENVLWTGNIGVMVGGRRVILDSANFGGRSPLLLSEWASDSANQHEHRRGSSAQVREGGTTGASKARVVLVIMVIFLCVSSVHYESKRIKEKPCNQDLT